MSWRFMHHRINIHIQLLITHHFGAFAVTSSSPSHVSYWNWVTFSSILVCMDLMVWTSWEKLSCGIISDDWPDVEGPAILHVVLADDIS